LELLSIIGGMTHAIAALVRVALGTLALAATVMALPALGQSAAAAAPVDLVARLKEAEGNPRQWEAMFKVGRKVAAFCANCHGEGGNSVDIHTPNLAGQNPYYLLQQVREFGATQRKSNEFKKRLVNVMTPDEKIGMVIFYAGQEVTFKPAADAALAKKGEALYARRCGECHEKDGRGDREYSRVAGQQPGYMSKTLKGYRDGSGPRIHRQMADEIKPLSDADIAAIVAYVSAMK
jgi:cytochrome c553